MKAANQRDDEREEPGVDEEIVSADLDDVQEQRGHGQQDALGHHKLLQSIFQEEAQRLRREQTRNKFKSTRI